MGQGYPVSISEVMGPSAGWLAAGAALAKRRDHPHDPPHLILLPEIPFNQEKVIEDIKRVLKREKFCQIVVAEGLVDSDGNYVAADAQTDAFGHAQLGGAGDALAEIVGQNIPGVKVRVAKPGLLQRCVAHSASKTDADEAYLTGPKVHCCHVAVDESGELAGFQTLGRYPGLPGDIGDIGTFARIEGKQRGVGSALFPVTVTRARQLGHSAINATIRADNAGGLAFYAKQGFVDHGVTPGVSLADGTPVDRVHKRYSLTEQGSRC